MPDKEYYRENSRRIRITVPPSPTEEEYCAVKYPPHQCFVIEGKPTDMGSLLELASRVPNLVYCSPPIPLPPPFYKMSEDMWVKTDFPLKRDFYDPLPLFRNLQCRWQRGIREMRGSPRDGVYMGRNIRVEKTDVCHRELTVLTDCFSELARMTARVYGREGYREKSPLEYYIQNADDIKMDAGGNRFEMREILYRRVREAGLLSVASCRWVYDFFRPCRVFDPSAGWGDRLLAAAASDIEVYRGVDPNTTMTQNYESMIAFTEQVAGIGGEYKVSCDDFLHYPEERDPYWGTYDLVFTSPPYFDFEEYSHDEGQSIIKFPTLEEWICGFLEPYLTKAIGALREGGKLALYITDTSSGRYTQRARDLLSKIAIPLGVIKMGRGGRQPLWVFEKGSLEPPVTERILEMPSDDLGYFRVFDESEILGGTKQRLLNRIIPDIREREIVYAGPETGYAQVALSLVCNRYGKRLSLFLPSFGREKTPLTKMAEFLGAKVFLGKRRRMYQMDQRAREYASKRRDAYFMNLGCAGEEDIYSEAIRDAVSCVKPPVRLWVPVGSGMTLRALQRVWPETNFIGVQVGKRVDPKLIREGKDRLLVSERNFWEDSLSIPPYNSLRNYDAKVWDLFLELGKIEDAIWNVGGDL